MPKIVLALVALIACYIGFKIVSGLVGFAIWVIAIAVTAVIVLRILGRAAPQGRGPGFGRAPGNLR